MNLKKALFFMVLGLVFYGCDKGSPDVDVAVKVADNFYQAQLDGDVDRALKAYSESVDQGLWRSHLEHVTASLGELQSYALQHKEVNTKNSGRLYVFDYKTTYSHGETALETLTMFNKIGSEEILIVSHAISADNFDPLF